MLFEISIKNLVKIQEESDKVIKEIEELNGRLHVEGGDRFSDFYYVSGVNTGGLEKLNDPERKVRIEISGWFRLSDSKMKGELKRYGIYRFFVSGITRSPFPVVIDIPEKVWNRFKFETTPFE
jgi:hypothetical protein